MQESFDTLEICNYINSFFTTIASNLVAKLPPSPGRFSTSSSQFKSFYSSQGITPGHFTIKPVSLEYIRRELLKMNPLKATGIDGISPRFLKDGANQLAPVLQHVLNLSILHNKIPDDLKHAKVTPLFKKKR